MLKLAMALGTVVASLITPVLVSPAAAATDALKDLAQLLPNEATDDDFIDLAETQAFAPEVMDGECSA